MRLEIQKKIIETCRAGTFKVVKYEKGTDLPFYSGECDIPEVRCNEIQGGIVNTSKRGARDSHFSIDNWLFEARLKFKQEVAFDEFLKTELSQVRFEAESGQMVTLSAGSFVVAHPAQHGNQSGTNLTIVITANTRS